MIVNVDWGNRIVNIPKSEMLLVQSSPVEIRQLDLTEFRYALHDAQDSEAGMAYPHIHNHNFAVTVAGVSLAQVVEIVNNYSVTFEDGLYNVNIVGGNSNVADRVNKNQVGVNTANSAGLQDSTSLQSASFGGAVTLDKQFGTAGTTFPIGTAGTPSNNVADARIIMQRQNISTMQIIRPTEIGAGDDISNIIVKGTNPMTSILNVLPDAVTDNALLMNLYFNGSLDGGSILRDCVVGAIDYFNGYIEHSAFTSSTININGTAVFLDCFAGATCIQAPILDLTGATGMAIRGYHGNLKIIEKHGMGICQIGMTGILTIEPTVDTGGIDIYGDARVIDNSTGTFVLNDQTTDTRIEIADAVWSSATRELTSASGMTPEQEAKVDQIITDVGALPDQMSEAELHAGLDSYVGKDLYKADVSNLSADVNVVEVAGVAVTSIEDFKAAPTDLSSVLSAIAALNNVSATDVRAAFNAVDFKDKNTELEIHMWLDSYANKADWKESVAADLTVTNTKIDAVQISVDAIPTAAENAAELLGTTV